MHPDFVKFLGFKWMYNGKMRYFVFLVLPFGLCSGPRICKKLFRPLVVFWRDLGILNIIFYDDGIVAGMSYDDCKKKGEIVFDTLMRAHILPNCKKSVWKPTKICDWLGYTWCYDNYEVKVVSRRITQLKDRIIALKSDYPVVTPRKVAKVVGSFISMQLVFQDKVLLHSRFLQHVVNFREIADLSWDTKLNVNIVDKGHKILEEMDFLLENLGQLKFSFFQSAVTRSFCLCGGRE